MFKSMLDFQYFLGAEMELNRQVLVGGLSVTNARRLVQDHGFRPKGCHKHDGVGAVGDGKQGAPIDRSHNIFGAPVVAQSCRNG